MTEARPLNLLSTVLVVHGALLFALTVTSLLVPVWLGNLAGNVMAAVPVPAIVTRSLESNYAILAPLSSAEYAEGFRGLQFFALVLEPICAVLLFASTAVVRPPGASRIVGVAFLGVGALLFWWCFLCGDFFGADDRDFTGVLRPWFGTVIYSMVCWLIPLTVVLLIYSLIPKHKR